MEEVFYFIVDKVMENLCLGVRVFKEVFVRIIKEFEYDLYQFGKVVFDSGVDTLMIDFEICKVVYEYD